MVQSPELTSAQVDSALARVLARPEFGDPGPSLLVRWLGRALSWTREQLGRLIDWLLPDFQPDASVVARVLDIVVFLAAIAGALVLAWLGVVAYRAWRGRARRRAVATARSGGPVSTQEWEAAARAAAAAGRWREASLATYQAVVFRLAERGAIRLDPAKTPGDYRREARATRADQTSAIEAFVRVFERVAYGPDSADSEYFSKLRESAIRLGVRV